MILNLSILTMNQRTFNKRLQLLSSEIDRHPQADELLNIMLQQIQDDTPVIEREVVKAA